MSNIAEAVLVEKFKDREYFTREELFDFYRSFEPELKEATFAWRIHILKNKNILNSPKRGLYIISDKLGYVPEISSVLLKLARHITERFGDINFCIWETSWLNEFAQHMIGKNTLFIEIEKGFEESLFYELKGSMRKEVFISPDEKAIDLYISQSSEPIIIKKLLARAPLLAQTSRGFKYKTPSLEKILVDLFTDEKLFYYLQGSELIHIYENAISKYPINFTKLFGYARRREREKEIKQFLTVHMFSLVKDIISD